MSNVRWTEEQESAITSRDRNLLLSAAAGSGTNGAGADESINEQVLVDQDGIKITASAASHPQTSLPRWHDSPSAPPVQIGRASCRERE